MGTKARDSKVTRPRATSSADRMRPGFGACSARTPWSNPWRRALPTPSV
jgi:hypothetical protein